MQYGLANGDVFLLRAGRDEGLATLEYTWSAFRDFPRSFGLVFDCVWGVTRVYISGYHSWYGSFYAELPLGRTQRSTGFALAQLVPQDGGQGLIPGFGRYHRFRHTFVSPTASRRR